MTELQETIREVKSSREMGGRYMLLEELLQDERAEGRAEGKLLNLIQLVCRKLSKGKTSAQISEELEQDISVIEPIVTVASSYAPEYDAEKIYEALQDSQKSSS